MNHFRSLAIGATLMVSLTSLMQQTVAAQTHGDEQGQTQSGAPSAMPTVDQHLKALSEKLDLTAEQQAKFRPILQRMQDESQNAMRDTTLSDQARHDKLKSIHDKAEKQARPMLTKEQNKKLDELEQQPHPDIQGNGSGAARPPQ